MKTDEVRQFRFRCFHLGESGLGDLLLMGADIKTHNDIVVVLTHARAHLAPLFYGIAPVLVTPEYQSEIRPSPADGMPEIRLTEKEREEGHAFVAGVKKPVAICINCSPAWKHLRETSMVTWENVCNWLTARGFTPIQFGISSNVSLIPSIAHHLDLPIRKLAAVYSAIGLYVGIDTGDRWLMTAAGGKSWVLCPDNCTDYPWSFWHRDCGGRAKYFRFNQLQELYDSIDAR
jgi:hypothetical protein